MSPKFRTKRTRRTHLERILVGWRDTPDQEIKWCKAQYKETTRYQDSIPTACGYVITLPVGLAHPDNQDVTCPDCLKKLVRDDGVPDQVFLVDNPNGPSHPTRWHLFGDCGALAGVCFGSTGVLEASKILGTKLSSTNICARCRTRNESTPTVTA